MSPFIGPRRVPAAVRLVVLHHAGSSAVAYHPLVRQRPDGWEVLLLDLPGRGARHGEAPSRVMSRVVDGVFGGILKHVDPPYALFGHRMDAIVATEVGRRLAALHRYLVWVGSRPGGTCDSGRRRGTAVGIGRSRTARHAHGLGLLPAWID